MSAVTTHAGGGVLPVLALTGLALAGLALPLAFVGDPVAWIDEIFSLYHARQPIGAIWGTGWRLETSPPLYYSLLWGWSHLAGTGEVAARLLSWLLTGAAGLFVALAARRIGGTGAAGWAALVFLCNPLVGQYALEIRPYALLLLEASIALWACAGLLALRPLEAAQDRRAALQSAWDPLESTCRHASLSIL